MKRLKVLIGTSLLILIFILLSNTAFAGEKIDPEAEALFQAAFPSHKLMLSDQCGYTAAAVLRDDQAQVLCLAEKRNGVWEMVIANPTALRRDTSVTSLLLDTDETPFWVYQTDGSLTETYHAVRSGGQWRVTSIMSRENHDNGNISEYHTWYEKGRLQYSTYFCDENENIMSYEPYAPVPAMWLDALMPLNCYDDTRFPKPNCKYTHSWLSEEVTALAAAELFPNDTFLGGCAHKEHLEFFLQRPNEDRIIASCRFHEKDGWRITISTPLPQGTAYGRENFSSSLVIGDLLVNIGPVDENTCGVTYIYNTADNTSGEPMFSLGKNWVTGEVPNGYEHCFGDHPWSDITVIDWNSLPQSLEEALSRLDSSDWAVVNNPNPSDRLHLRSKADRSAKSLGKYYNGTPVRILEETKEWVRVDIFGVQGWMMKEYLAFGSKGHAVEAVFPSRVALETSTHHYLYETPETSRTVPGFQPEYHGLVVLAIVGDEWYHVWFPNANLTGYVLQSEWWEGNG